MSPDDRKPFFSNPTVRKIYVLIFLAEFTLSTGALIAATLVEPAAIVPFLLMWTVMQVGYLSMIAIIYLMDKFRIWVEKTYSLSQQLIIYIALMVIMTILLRNLHVF